MAAHAVDQVVLTDPYGWDLSFSIQAITPHQVRAEVVRTILEVAKLGHIEVFAAPLYEVEVPRLFVKDNDWPRMIDLLERESDRGLVLAPFSAGKLQNPAGSLAGYQLRRDKKARVFIPVATTLDGPAWGSECGISLEAGYVYDDLSSPTSHTGRFLAAYAPGGTTTVEVAGVEVQSFVGLVRQSPMQVSLDIDAVFEQPQDWELLRYSLRSLHLYAPWIRQIFLITNDSLPSWLDTNIPGINPISVGDATSIHDLPQLAEHYLRVCDSGMFSRCSEPGQFFDASGLVHVEVTERPVDIGDPSLAETRSGQAALALNRWSVERYGRIANFPPPLGFAPTTKTIERLAAKEHVNISTSEDRMDPLALSQTIALNEGKAVFSRSEVGTLAFDASNYETRELEQQYPVPSPWEVENEDLPA